MTARIKTGSHIVSSSAVSFFGLVKPGTTFWGVGGGWGEVEKVWVRRGVGWGGALVERLIW